MLSSARVEINYFLELGLVGRTFIQPRTVGNHRRKHDEHVIDIFNLRTCTGRRYDIGSYGFQLIEHGYTENDFEDKSWIKAVAYAEASELLKRV
jgi:hypothetical protein